MKGSWYQLGVRQIFEGVNSLEEGLSEGEVEKRII